MTLETLATWIVLLGSAYLGIGLLFAIGFVSRGVQRIDPQAVGGTWGFRVAILPGAMALWPLLLRRWLRREPPPEERTPHRRAARRADSP